MFSGSAGIEQRQLVCLISKRSWVQIPLPLPKFPKVYNGSEKHLSNLALARAIARRTISLCQYCGAGHSISNIKKHEECCYLNPANIRYCPVCNTPAKGEGLTCSHACANTHFRSGANHPKWKEDSYRSTCFEYHEKKCAVCPESLIVEVHHMDENRNNNSPENLIPPMPDTSSILALTLSKPY